MVAAAVEYRQPEHILPRYADFMYRVVLGAVAIRSRLYFLADDAQVCPVCGDLETYDHLLLRCEFVTAVWAVFQPLVDALKLELPTTLSALLFEPLVTGQRYRRRAVAMMWPILRACVLHTVWLARNDRVFRPEAPLVTPEAAAQRAAFLTKLLNTQALCLFQTMAALRHDAWLRDNFVPACAVYTPRLPLPLG
ncbi:hypothetical protein SPRG_22308 [Saprolegnia parasitica CBS 223.65]|uniref:Reverse transcriptase zinc-binding domain-containing protein n=1 Tax=Saprolegnia parasitica (strain CBS 223.65) TaxID=695850 RepID=A0A067BVA5_SAPPC|nr:hypothetical protein SPRG_22308 [Saprolegnia parasitica CBS 223.65]KDO22479.1 hypothetical protein SPRG_22308 [Saprolegnia parasitica CBS 223.65]|eukprot:XP_012206875.1 hypothetical protein SPRG_22308 [Saprolegnia parasitica CBS 223.65]